MLTVGLFFLAFNTLEAVVEALLFGERLEHWLDLLFMVIWMAYAGATVWYCAAYNLAGEGS
ncbi:hypothetical protein [Alloalcanivorax xenomutans]|uniref:hypothetical protein n=1 Tax=Alloalcanivorax xenomutans TaxID=1094342 RepID=UPI003BAB24B9